MNVVPMTNRFSRSDYERERERIRETYGDSTVEAGAKRDQALAGLFYMSGWTQQELAEVEGKTRQWVAYRIRFGKFLEFATTVANQETLPKNLTERRFRSYWDRGNSTGPLAFLNFCRQFVHVIPEVPD